MKKFYLAALMALALGVTGTAGASPYKNNPYTLVYDHAITENVKNQVNIHPVNYQLHGVKIAANVYTPANFDPAKKYPTIVVAHPNGGVKEQVAGLYAQRLAELGYVTIAADAAFQEPAAAIPATWTFPTTAPKIFTAWWTTSASTPVWTLTGSALWASAAAAAIP